MISTSTRSLVIVFSLALALSSANAIDWPPDYTVLANSTSPDGRYGVLVVSREAGLNDDRTAKNSVYVGRQTQSASVELHEPETIRRSQNLQRPFSGHVRFEIRKMDGR